MRKFLLVLFLCALTSNALAKVEMWECDSYGDGGKVFKIDTSIPIVYSRHMGEWINQTSLELKYSEEHNSISSYNSKGTRVDIWDLILKEFIVKVHSKTKIFRCKVRE